MGKFIEAWRNGQVVRKHTMENIRAENIAEHTWGVVMLLMIAWPNVPSRIIFGVQIHDCGERGPGDVPGQVKWKNPQLGEMMDDLEREHMRETLPEHMLRWLESLGEVDLQVIEFFDRAEFCVSMSRERRLGNTYSMIYFRRALNKAEKTLQDHWEEFEAMDPQLLRGMRELVDELREEEHNLGVLRG